MNRKQRRKAAKDLSQRLNRLRGYARRGSARAMALVALAKKQWAEGGLSQEDLDEFRQKHDDASKA